MSWLTSYQKISHRIGRSVLGYGTRYSAVCPIWYVQTLTGSDICVAVSVQLYGTVLKQRAFSISTQLIQLTHSQDVILYMVLES